jgi:glutathione S-transferase
MTCVEKGIDYELVPIAYGSDEHRALHPFAKIPVLEAPAGVIFETFAITAYLDEAFPGPSLQPAEPLARARMHTWMGLCSDYLYREVVRGIPRDRDPSVEELQAAKEALERAESLMGEERFLAGSQVTLADLYLAPQVANCGEKAPQLLDGLERIGIWAARMASLESFMRTTRQS